MNITLYKVLDRDLHAARAAARAAEISWQADRLRERLRGVA